MDQADDLAALLRGRLFVAPVQAARVLGVDRRTLYRAIEAGDVPAIKVGAQWRVATAWLRAAAQVPGDAEAGDE